MFRGKQVVLLKSQLQTLEICQQNLVINALELSLDRKPWYSFGIEL